MKKMATVMGSLVVLVSLGVLVGCSKKSTERAESQTLKQGSATEKLAKSEVANANGQAHTYPPGSRVLRSEPVDEGIEADRVDNQPLKYTTIHEAAAKGDLDDVKRHLCRGTAVNERAGPGNATPLHAAAGFGQTKVAEFLIEKGAEVNAVGGALGYGWATPLEIAAEEGHIEIVRLLIQKGADIAKHGSDAIGLAFENGHTEIALEIAKSVDVKAKNEKGVTLLHEVAGRPRSGKDYTEIVELLINRGADVNVKSEGGGTPLHEAAFSGQAKIAELLINRGADVNAGSGAGETPLQTALSTGGYTDHPRDIEIVKVLVRNGADVNVRDRDGCTPLHRALSQHDISPRIEIVKLLVEKGADINVKDKMGWTPLHWAERINEPEIAELLREHGAKE